MLERELTVVILDQTETLLGFLDTDLVEIEEKNEYQKLRTITVTHPMFNPNSTDNTIYRDLLIPGNKIWREETCDGVPCLYVILGPVKYDNTKNLITITAEEVATELSQNQVFRSSSFSWTVNSTFISTYFGNLFRSGTLTGPGTTNTTLYTGALTPMAILRQIESDTGGEFQFRYEYDSNTKTVKRYIDYFDTIGTTHNTIIDLSYNAVELGLNIDETDTRIASAPIGKPTSDSDEFHKNLKAFEDLAVSTSSQIYLYVTQDDNGNTVNGPLTYPPYNKPAGQNYVACDDSGEIVANYNYIHDKEGGAGSYPRLYTFESSETNPINLYWDCVDNLRQYLEPEINIDCTVVDLKKLNDETTPEYYNVGDLVYINLPIYGVINARITSTTKDPRRLEDDNIGIGNYQTGFVESRYKSAGMIDLNSTPPVG